jgi:hypothetical protein
VLNQFNIKTAVSTILINAVEKDLTGTKLLTRLYQPDCVDVSSFTAAFDGALIPADSGTENENFITFMVLGKFC